MKITRIRTYNVSLPLQQPLITAIHRSDTLGVLAVVLETDSDLVGESYLFALNRDRLPAFDAMINSLAQFVVGQDPVYVEKIWQQMWLDCNPVGHKGVAICAMSALDTALWDLVGKRANMPLYQLFGACRDHVKAYASSGLWLSDTIDQLIARAHGFVEQGFLSIKMRLGKENPSEDVARASALRQALGDDIEILADANQSLTVRGAMQLAHQLRDLNIGWLEEPVAAHDLQGHARVLQAIDIPLASGESEYTRFGMKDMLDRGAVDILMPDLQRIGGLSEMRKSAALAACYNIPISTHIFTEQSLSIAGSAANCISVEHVDWFAPLFVEKMAVVDGQIAMPQAPGLGFNFDYDFIHSAAS